MKKIIILLLLALSLPAHASPSNDDLDAYRARLQVYLSLKQSPEQIIVSLGNYFGRLGNFQTRNNVDGTITIVYVEGDGNTIRFIANVVTIKPVYEVAP